MKKLLLISVFIILMFPLFSKSWATKKTEELGVETGVKEGNFALAVALYTEEVAISEGYEEWVQKRYSKTRMVEEAKRVIQGRGKEFRAILIIGFGGNFLSEGKTLIDIPTNLNEYIFAENERGEYLRCTNTGNISWLRSVGVLNVY